MMTGQPDEALGGMMMQNFAADIGRALATPPPPAGESMATLPYERAPAPTGRSPARSAAASSR